ETSVWPVTLFGGTVAAAISPPVAPAGTTVWSEPSCFSSVPPAGPGRDAPTELSGDDGAATAVSSGRSTGAAATVGVPPEETYPGGGESGGGGSVCSRRSLARARSSADASSEGELYRSRGSFSRHRRTMFWTMSGSADSGAMGSEVVRCWSISSIAVRPLYGGSPASMQYNVAPSE